MPWLRAAVHADQGEPAALPAVVSEAGGAEGGRRRDAAHCSSGLDPFDLGRAE